MTQATLTRGKLSGFGYIPPGGATGDLLVKASGDDGDVEWGGYRQTTAENAASVTPVNYAYGPGVANRYANNTIPGTTDMTAALQTMADLSVSHPGILLSETYLKTAVLTVKSNAIITGPGWQNCIIKDTTGNGLARQGSSDVNNVTLRGFQLQTTNDGTNTKIGFDFTRMSYGTYENLASQFHNTGFKFSRGPTGGPAGACYFNHSDNLYGLRNKTPFLLDDILTGTTPNANMFGKLFAEDVGVWAGGNGLDLSGYGNKFDSIYVGLPSGNSAIKIRNIAGTNQIDHLYAESSMTYAIDNSVGTSGRRNAVHNIHVDSATMKVLATVGDQDLLVFNAEATIDTAADPKYLGAWNTVNIRRPEAILTLDSVAAGAKKWKIISGGGTEIGAGAWGLQNTTDARNVIRVLGTSLADTILADGDGMTVKSLKVDVIATASLPAAGATQNGRIVIEDNGTGDRNIVIYAGGQRFRLDGGAAF